MGLAAGSIRMLADEGKPAVGRLHPRFALVVVDAQGPLAHPDRPDDRVLVRRAEQQNPLPVVESRLTLDAHPESVDFAAQPPERHAGSGGEAALFDALHLQLHIRDDATLLVEQAALLHDSSDDNMICLGYQLRQVEGLYQGSSGGLGSDP